MRSVLISNGDFELKSYLFDLLSAEGYRVETAKNCFDAIQQVLTERPDVVVMGIDHEGISALEAIRVMNKIDIDLPIIAMTHDPSLEMEKKVRREKIFYYIVKPIDREEMKAAVRDALLKSCHRKKGS